MIIIIDSNIIIAAIIKDATTRKIITDLCPDIYFPEAMVKEIKKYKEIIKKKVGLNEEEFGEVLERLFKYIRIIPNETLMNHKEEAKEIMESIDVADSLLIAAALSFKTAIIWSNDLHLKQQTRSWPSMSRAQDRSMVYLQLED